MNLRRTPRIMEVLPNEVRDLNRHQIEQNEDPTDERVIGVGFRL